MITPELKDFILSTVRQEVRRALQEKPSRKHSFEKSPYFDKHEFAKALKGWSRAKLKHYYDEASLYSESKGAQYVNWAAAVKKWDRLHPFQEPPARVEYVPPDTSNAATQEEIRVILKGVKMGKV